jgi:NADPH2:quinone reductase
MKAIVVTSFDTSQPLTLSEVPTPEPGPGQVRVRNKTIGVNFVDLQHRAGQPYPVGLPLIPGIEAAGLVDAVGPGVTLVKPGDRVAFAGHLGAYAEFTVLPAERMIPLPRAVSFNCAAASLLQGMTAHALVHSISPLRSGEYVLIHAAGSGVGLQLVQTARAAGAMVIGSVSTQQKMMLAKRFGARHVVLHTRDNIGEHIARITSGAGVHVIFDASGATTLDANLRLLRATGRLVLYGITDGVSAPFDVNRLSGITGGGNRGSLSVTWAALSDYTATRAALLAHARPVLNGRMSGRLQSPIFDTLPLADAQRAHDLLRSRQIAGKLLLTVDA